MAWVLYRYDSVTSTQDVLKSHLAAHPDGGVCVQAAEQTQGRGRHGRVWEGASGNLMFSFAMRFGSDAARIGEISMLCGLAVARVLVAILPDSIMLKWPNDVLANGRKICGLLLEMEDDFIVVGVGVNITHSPYEHGIALNDIAAGDYSADDVREAILEQFENLYAVWQREGFEQIREQWLEMSCKRGAKVTVKMPDGVIEGAFETIDEGGALVVKDSHGGYRKISSGDVFLGTQGKRAL